MAARPASFALLLCGIAAAAAVRPQRSVAQDDPARGASKLAATCSSYYGALRGLRGADPAAGGLTVRGLLGGVTAAARRAPLLPLDLAAGVKLVSSLLARYERNGASDASVVASHEEALAALLAGVESPQLRGLDRKKDWAGLAELAGTQVDRLSAGRPYLALSCADDPAAVWTRSGTIAALDAAKRLVTLKSAEGDIDVVVPADAAISKAGDAAASFGSLRAGDEASLAYARPDGPLRIRVRAR